MQISLVVLLLLLGFVATKKYKDVNVSSCPRSKQVAHAWLCLKCRRKIENIGGDQADEPGGRKDQRELERRQRLHREDQVEEGHQHPGACGGENV